jgi:hypothetical protein
MLGIFVCDEVDTQREAEVQKSKLRSRGRMLVRSPHRCGPKAESGSTSRLGRGRPTDPWLVPPRRTVLYRGGGGHDSRDEVSCTATNPTYNPSDRGSTGAAGSTTITAADIMLYHPYTLPPSASTPFLKRHLHYTVVIPATSTPSRGSPCYFDRRDGQPTGSAFFPC